MLAKTGMQSRKNWDACLPSILSHCTYVQWGESPFYLLYGWDCQLKPCFATHLIPLYFTRMTTSLRWPWRWQGPGLARDSIKKVQAWQKVQHDRHAWPQAFQEGERVFVFMPAAHSGKSYTLSRPFHYPYCVIRVHEMVWKWKTCESTTSYHQSCLTVSILSTWYFLDKKDDRQGVETCDDESPMKIIQAQKEESACSSHLQPRTRMSWAQGGDTVAL